MEAELDAKVDTIETLELKVLELTALVDDYEAGQGFQEFTQRAQENGLGRIQGYLRAGEGKPRPSDPSVRGIYREVSRQPDWYQGYAAQIRKLLAEKKVLENRRNASTLRTWETRLKGRACTRPRDDCERALRGDRAAPDSSKKGSSSEFKQMTYV